MCIYILLFVNVIPSIHFRLLKYIFFRNNNSINCAQSYKLFYIEYYVSSKDVAYLGATLDQCLSCESMAGSIIKKTCSRLQFQYRKRDYLTQYTKRLLVIALIQCHFDYACSFWFHGLPQVWKNKLQTTQNKIIRFVLNLESRTHPGSCTLCIPRMITSL